MFNIINKSELIAKDLEFLISQQEYVKSIPSERKLAVKYNVSRNTIREALEILQNKGIISLESNSYHINSPKEDYDWLEFFGKKSNHRVKNYLIKNTVIEANKKIAQKLKVPLATPIHYLIYKRTINEQESAKTLSLDYIYAPEKLVEHLPLNKLLEHSFWDLLVKSYRGTPIKEYQNLSIESVNFEEASLLAIPVRAKILQRTSIVNLNNNFIYFVSKKVPENVLLMQVDKDKNNE